MTNINNSNIGNNIRATRPDPVRANRKRMTNNNVLSDIREHIRRMRAKQYEPEVIYVSRDVYAVLGGARSFGGVSVECDRRLKGMAFEVR